MIFDNLGSYESSDITNEEVSIDVAQELIFQGEHGTEWIFPCGQRSEVHNEQWLHNIEHAAYGHTDVLIAYWPLP